MEKNSLYNDEASEVCLKYVKSMGRGFLLHSMQLSLHGYT